MRGPWPKGVGFYGLLGAVLIIGGGFLPWISSGSKSVTAWNIPIAVIATTKDVGGPMIGPVLLIAVLVLLPYVIRRRLPMLVRVIIAGIALSTSSSILVVALRLGSPLAVGIGAVITLAGAVMMFLGDAGMRGSTERNA